MGINLGSYYLVMRILELQNLAREEGQIFYIRKYKCDAVLELPKNQEKVPIIFTIETSPLGKKIIELTFTQAINYPLIPVKKALLEYIYTEEIEGRIPC